MCRVFVPTTQHAVLQVTYSVLLVPACSSIDAAFGTRTLPIMEMHALIRPLIVQAKSCRPQFKWLLGRRRLLGR